MPGGSVLRSCYLDAETSSVSSVFIARGYLRPNTQNRHPFHLLPLSTLHCTVMRFALEWESHKSLKHDGECLTELLERAFLQPYAIQRIQLAEVDWESENKGFD